MPSKNKLPDNPFPEVEAVYESFSEDILNLDYDEIKHKYLGKKGLVIDLLCRIKEKQNKEKPLYGKAVNSLKNAIEQKINTLRGKENLQQTGKMLTKDAIDITAPFDVNIPLQDKPKLISQPGSLHPITEIGEKALRIFESMGFHVTYSRRLDNDYNVFEALNLPPEHPARDMWDTFWTQDDLIPITHTSAMQNRILTTKKVPIREVIVGRCMRNEATDASHEHTFYQVEGMYVDKGITLAHLIGTLSAFMNEFYGRDVKYRIQPSYFPFVEPGLEFLIECLTCGQKGCPFCGYSGWVELVPCGPIHPNVLREGGYDPETYTGFAWGLGYDRLVILQSHINDIRHIHSGDLKFLEQFK
ncbi:phenylalanine--tRNA ligase subunit alpha [Candidatus Dojkabacteria bacterium]|nr:phenylalanine--tRNA ligase subunit alpha [Candidatus Dojkabacteria bacterium]